MMAEPVPGEPLEVVAADGYRLGATRFAAPGPERGSIVIAAATGVPEGFYRRYAAWAAARGFTTWTFDYRGIGRSRPATLKGFPASFLDWAQLDLAAVIDTATGQGLPPFLVGHSFGGHVLGLLPEPTRVAGLWVCGTGAGWHGWMPWPERWKVWLAWNVLLPPLVAWFGYMPWGRLGAGEDLPLGVYQQWQRWCGLPRYFFDDPLMRGLAERFARVQTPIFAVNAEDDLWAPPRSRNAFIQGYRNAPLKRRDVDPKASGIGPIGHMGYFRASAEPLWAEGLAWFEDLMAADGSKP